MGFRLTWALYTCVSCTLQERMKKQKAERAAAAKAASGPSKAAPKVVGRGKR